MSAVLTKDNLVTTPVTVEADGVKTWSQLLDELYAKIDQSKITVKSSVLSYNGSSYAFYAIIGYKPSQGVQAMIADGTGAYYEFYMKSSNSTYKRLYVNPSDYSQTVAGASNILSLYY